MKINIGNKILSPVLMAAGVILLVASLAMDFAGTGSNSATGTMLVLGIVAFLIGLYLFPTLKHHRAIVYVIFLFPLLFTFLVTVIIPLVLGIGYSFTDWTGIKMTKVVGLANYQTMFKDPSFVWSILITFIFVAVNMIMINVVGFALALLCTSKMRGTSFFRAAYFLPNLIGGIVLSYIWLMIFNSILAKHSMTIVSTQWTAFWGLVAVVCWQQIGYMMIIYIAGIQNIPADLIEAAKIDGANNHQLLRYVTIPMLMPTITICTFLTLTNGFKLFDQNLALTGGKPGKLSELLALNIYDTMYGTTGWQGVGQAKAVIFFILVAIIALIQNKLTTSKEVEQ